MKYVTIATDISNDSNYKITTWACYIRHSGGVIKETGQFKRYMGNTAAAETYALLNALVIAEKNVPDWSESTVIIHNEIEHVLTPCTTKYGNIRKRDAERADAIKSIALPILSQAVKWERRKIKAHYKNWRTSDNPAKYAINRWCDKNSRDLLRKLRDSQRKS